MKIIFSKLTKKGLVFLSLVAILLLVFFETIFATDRVRCIMPYKGGIALIKRIKKDAVYFVFPGGGVEEGESLETALHREIKEELGVKIEIIKKLCTDIYGDDINHYFLCKYIDGKIGTGNGPEFHISKYLISGEYIPIIVPFDDIPKINLVPNLIRDRLVLDLSILI